ncbi:hypothetical protein ACI3QQ_02035 [Propionibacterium freudenreichii]
MDVGIDPSGINIGTLGEIQNDIRRWPTAGHQRPTGRTGVCRLATV